MIDSPPSSAVVEITSLLEITGGLIIALVSGFWALARANSAEHTKTRDQGEQRAVRTYAKIDEIRNYVDEGFVRKDMHLLHMEKISDALDERDRQLEDLKDRFACRKE
jgi:hypothetical protein